MHNLKSHFHNFIQINRKLKITMNFSASIIQKLQILNRVSLLQKMRNVYQKNHRNATHFINQPSLLFCGQNTRSNGKPISFKRSTVEVVLYNRRKSGPWVNITCAQLISRNVYVALLRENPQQPLEAKKKKKGKKMQNTVDDRYIGSTMRKKAEIYIYT